MEGDPYNTAPPKKSDPWQQEPIKKDRRKNPSHATVIYARRRKSNKMVGEWMWWDGKKFTNNQAPYYFGTRDRAKALARQLKRRYPALDRYRLYVGAPNRLLQQARVRNPHWPTEQDQIDEAARRLEDFSGHAARRVVKVRSRSNRKTGLIVGELDLIGYRTKREGIDGGKLVKYEHTFRSGSRPLLAVSSDGTQLHIVGGRYEFTEAGIEDR
jgi:hypothetical protein